MRRDQTWYVSVVLLVLVLVLSAVSGGGAGEAAWSNVAGQHASLASPTAEAPATLGTLNSASRFASWLPMVGKPDAPRPTRTPFSTLTATPPTATRTATATPTYTPTPMATPATSFRFASTSDTQNGAANLAVLSPQIMALNPRFLIFPGDVVSDDITTGLLATWKDALNGGWSPGNGLSARTIPVRGNHDWESPATTWESFFDTAGTVAMVGGRDYSSYETDRTFSFDYGNSHFVGIDVNGDVRNMTAGQIAWLDTDLAAAEARGVVHSFLFWHGPVYPVAQHCCGIPPSSLVTVLNKHTSISALFHGHEHTVAYTHLDSSRLPNLTHSVEQFVTAGGGVNQTYATIDSRVDWSMTAGCPESSSGTCSPAIHGFALVEVNGRSFTVSAYQKGTEAAILKGRWTFTK